MPSMARWSEYIIDIDRGVLLLLYMWHNVALWLVDPWLKVELLVGYGMAVKRTQAS